MKYIVRRLSREPAFVAGVSLTFALAISATAAMFTLVDRLMLAPPPGVERAERIVSAHFSYASDEGEAMTMETTSFPVFQTVAEERRLFANVAIARPDTVTLGRGADLTNVAAIEASGNYFSALGAGASLGRLFGADDDALAGSDVVVLSHAFWQRRFGGERGIVGQTIILGGTTLTIIGVAAPGFNGTGLSPVDVFLPLSTAMRNSESGWRTNSGMLLGQVVARLHEGVAPAMAAQGVTAALKRAQGDRANGRVVGATLEPLAGGRTARESTQGRVTLWLTGVAMLVLVIATANAATLLLLRGARRRRDAGIRLALGSSTARLLRDSMLEGLILAFVGAVCGIVLSYWLADLIRVTLLPTIAPLQRTVSNRGVVLALVIATGAGMLAGIAPIAFFRGRELATQLRVSGDFGASGRFVTQRILVALQVMVCTVLLVGAALFVRSMQRVQSQDLGFSTSHLLYVTLDFPDAFAESQHNAVFEDAVRRIRGERGVRRATVAQGLPFGSHNIPPIDIPGHPLPPPNEQQLPIMYGATPELLAMFGIRPLDGRLLTDQDRRGTPLVVLVNETMARNAWPGERAIGKCIRIGFPADFDINSN
ncbi:MAG: ABC transporter permease, partial [Gemmatimonadaceae bacterium]